MSKTVANPKSLILKAAYFALVAIGETPSVRGLRRMVKQIDGKGVQSAIALAWLRNRVTLGQHLGNGAVTPPPNKIKDSVTEGKQSGNLRARDLIELPLELELKESKDSVLEPALKSKKARKIPSEGDIAAWRLCDAAFKIVSGCHTLAMSSKTWRTRNANQARSLLGAGKTHDEIIAVLDFALTDPKASRWYGKITMLSKLAEHWPNIVSIRDDKRGQQNAGYDPSDPDTWEFVDDGVASILDVKAEIEARG